MLKDLKLLLEVQSLSLFIWLKLIKSTAYLLPVAGVIAAVLWGVHVGQCLVWRHQRANRQAKVDVTLHQPQNQPYPRVLLRVPALWEPRGPPRLLASSKRLRLELWMWGARFPHVLVLFPGPKPSDGGRALAAGRLLVYVDRSATVAHQLFVRQRARVWVWNYRDVPVWLAGEPAKGCARHRGDGVGHCCSSGLAGTQFSQLFHRVGADRGQSKHVAKWTDHPRGPRPGIGQSRSQSTLHHPQTLGWKPAAQHALLQPQQHVSPYGVGTKLQTMLNEDFTLLDLF